MAAAFYAFLNTELVNGARLVAENLGIYPYIQQADFVITGEGKIDSQTMQGKAPIHIAKLCKKARKPCIAFTGNVGESSPDEMFWAIFSIIQRPCTVENSMAQAHEWLEKSADKFAATLKIGETYGKT